MQVNDAPGISVNPVVWLPAAIGSQSRFAIRGSDTDTPVSVWLPVLVTRIEYEITSPAASTENGGVVSASTPVTVFSIESAGNCTAVTVAVA